LKTPTRHCWIIFFLIQTINANLSPSILRAIYLYKKKGGVLVLHSVHTFEYVCSHFAGYDYKKQVKCTDCAKSVFKFKIFYRKCSRLGFIHSIGKGVTSLISSFYINKNVIDIITTPSDFLKEKMLMHPKINNIVVLRNPILKNQDESNKIYRNSDFFYFVYFGRLSEEKNIECIIKSFYIAQKTYSNFRMKVIGSGVEKKKIENLVKNLNLSEKVFFYDFLPKEELDIELRSCNVSILSSKCYENAPMVVSESIDLGLIPIVCNHGGMKEMVDICVLGLKFNSNNHSELAEKMAYSYNNFNKLLLKLSYSKSKIKKLFNSEVAYNSLIKLYSR